MQVQHNLQNYKKISIQNLEARPQIQPKKQNPQNMINVINQQEKWNDKPNLYYEDSGIGQNRIIQRTSGFHVNHFFNAFADAYTQHGDLLLIPDEIWIMICFYISRYIDQNAQKLRKKLVKHQGVKTLHVQYVANTLQEAMQMQKNWDYFFDQIIKQIEKNSLNGVVKTFACDFSTTNKIYQVISTSIIMNSMKKFFKYQMDIGFACGINNVYMAGIRQDWVKILDKLQNMVQYDVDGVLKKYIHHMAIILKKFIQTFDGKPDVAWWNTIMTTPQKRSQYFTQILQVQGWILHFFGLYQRSNLQGFPIMNIEVPITLTNQWTMKQKQLVLVSDWVSVSKPDQRTYKPDVGVTIFEVYSDTLTNDDLQMIRKIKNKRNNEA